VGEHQVNDRTEHPHQHVEHGVIEARLKLSLEGLVENPLEELPKNGCGAGGEEGEEGNGSAAGGSEEV